MATVFTGTATDHADLLDKIRAHLVDPVLGTQAWTQMGLVTVSATERVAYMRGPGLAGTDEIFVAIQQYQDAANDYYNFNIYGAVGYSAAHAVTEQPGTSPRATVPLWNSAIPYTLIVDGRHFKLVAKISTTYQTAFAGFILPYATSAEMPYPMFIGGSATDANSRWSVSTHKVGSFFDPPEHSSYLRNFDGSWIDIANYSHDGSGVDRDDLTVSCVWPWHLNIECGANRDGSYGILPAIVHSSVGGGNVFGELPGVFWVSGFGNASEDTVTVGADTYLVVQSGYRTSMRSYAAIKLG